MKTRIVPSKELSSKTLRAEDYVTNVSPLGGSDECDECDGSGTYYIDGVPTPCICSESQDPADKITGAIEAFGEEVPTPPGAPK